MTDFLKEMAMFVVHLGFKPKEYYELTLEERNAIVKEWNRSKKRR